MIFNVIYEEKIRTPFIATSIFVLVAIFLFLLNFFPEFFNLQLNNGYKLAIAIAALADLLLYISFSRLTISLFPNLLRVNFGIFKTQFWKGDVQQVTIEDLLIQEWKGYGILFRKQKIGYIAKGGRGLRLRMNNKDFFISTENPEQLKDLIDKNLLDHDRKY